MPPPTACRSNDSTLLNPSFTATNLLLASFGCPAQVPSNESQLKSHRTDPPTPARVRVTSRKNLPNTCKQNSHIGSQFCCIRRPLGVRVTSRKNLPCTCKQNNHSRSQIYSIRRPLLKARVRITSSAARRSTHVLSHCLPELHLTTVVDTAVSAVDDDANADGCL